MRFPYFYCNIKARASRQSSESVEFLSWTDTNLERFGGWRWYFKYRAALLQVKYPRYYVELNVGSVESSGRTKEEIIKARIRAKKGKITEYSNKLYRAEVTHTELFPIKDDLLYQKAASKIERLKIELVELQNELIL